MINAAIVGLGRWGRTLVAAAEGSGKLRLTRAVVRDPGRHRDFAAAHRLEVAEELAPVLADPQIDAVVLATPHSLHCRQIIAAAAAGKAVFCEKPLCLEVADAERAIAACEEAGVVLGIGTDKRFFPAFQELLRLAKSGALGELLHLEAHFSNEVAGSFAGWRHDPAEAPAGGMTGTGVHMLDAMIALAGPVRRVQAQLLAKKPPPDPLDVISVLLEFESGASGTLSAVRSTPFYWRLHAFARYASAEALGRTELVLRRSGAETQRLTFAPVDSVRANLDAFADAVAGRAAYPIPTADMLAGVAAFAAIAAAVRG
ncbi:MAG TPA: Gfo/Idh/MocA family oxidoreductase [Stellaceae bacterium]|nr:Gfo/Idh/MocA family oxidoreductase [Stellaceae bacterium]